MTATLMKTISVLLRILHETEPEGIFGMLFADIFYTSNHGCKHVEFEALTITDTSTVVVHMYVIVTDMAHGCST